MKIIEYEDIHFINGYLTALGDIEGLQSFFRCRFLRANNENLSEKIGFVFSDMGNLKILKEKDFGQSYLYEDIFEKIILQNPFMECKIDPSILSNYREYMIFHLTDYVDFALEKVNITYKDQKRVTLLAATNKKRNFIILIIGVKDFDFIFLFSKRNLEDFQFDTLYSEIVDHHEVNIKKRLERHRRLNQEKNAYNNGLSKEVNDLCKNIINGAIKQGYLDAESKKILLKHFSKEKIDDLEKTFFEEQVEHNQIISKSEKTDKKDYCNNINRNNMQSVDNKFINIMNGYMDALSDIDVLGANELFAVNKLIFGDEALRKKVKFAFEFFNEYEVCYEVVCKSYCGIAHLLENVFIQNPFGSCAFDKKSLKNYRKRIASRSVDYIDSIFNDVIHGFSKIDRTIKYMIINQRSQYFLLVNIQCDLYDYLLLLEHKDISDKELKNLINNIEDDCQQQYLLS